MRSQLDAGDLAEGDKVKIAVCIIALLSLFAVHAAASDYVIGEGDILNVLVWGEDDLNGQVKVRPDGKISLQGIGECVAADLTMASLQDDLTKRFSKLVKNPIVTVSLIQSVNSQVFVVGGGVESVVYNLEQKTTLLHLLASLGPLYSADLHRAYLYREGKIVKSDFHDLILNGKFAEDVSLEAGDTVFIPLKEDVNVFVVGAVVNPKAIVWREGLTLLDAILGAGSFNKYADENETQVVRAKDGKKEMIPVMAGDLILKGDLKQNIVLEPGDYVIVKESFF